MRSRTGNTVLLLPVLALRHPAMQQPSLQCLCLGLKLLAWFVPLQRSVCGLTWLL